MKIDTHTYTPTYSSDAISPSELREGIINIFLVCFKYLYSKQNPLLCTSNDKNYAFENMEKMEGTKSILLGDTNYAWFLILKAMSRPTN